MEELNIKKIQDHVFKKGYKKKTTTKNKKHPKLETNNSPCGSKKC